MESSVDQQDQSNNSCCATCEGILNSSKENSSICDDCREKFIKYPIPNWIKGFGIGVLLVMIFSFFTLSGNIETEIHYNRGEKALEKSNYLTAENEFQKVVKSEPSYLQGQCKLLIAAFKNHDFLKVYSTYDIIKDKTIENESLMNEVKNALEEFTEYTPSDSTLNLLNKHNSSLDSVSLKDLASYVSGKNSDLFSKSQFASRLLENNDYTTCDSVLNNMLMSDAYQYNALAFKVAVKRGLNQFDSSYYYANRMLSLNHEDIYAMSSKSRTLLKEKKDDEALELARKAYNIDNNDGYVMTTLALIYHFKKDITNRDLMLKKASLDSTSLQAIAYVKDVISGKEIFRN